MFFFFFQKYWFLFFLGCSGFKRSHFPEKKNENNTPIGNGLEGTHRIRVRTIAISLEKTRGYSDFYVVKVNEKQALP